jgi:hypothetical protein
VHTSFKGCIQAYPSRDTAFRLIARALCGLPVVKGHKAVVDALQTALAREIDVHHVPPPREVEFYEVRIHTVWYSSHIEPGTFAMRRYLLSRLLLHKLESGCLLDQVVDGKIEFSLPKKTRTADTGARAFFFFFSTFGAFVS